MTCSELYTEAKLAKAKPIILLYFATDRGFRCFGKQTPAADHVDPAYNVFEIGPRVLSFGEFRQASSSDASNILQGLFEEQLNSYGASLDNADKYFCSIAGRETILSGEIILTQGWEYPGVTYSDYIDLYHGKITTYTFENLQFRFSSVQSIAPQEIEDPSVDTTTVYSLALSGSGTMAEEGYTYDTLEDVFFTATNWQVTIEIERSTTGINARWFKLVNGYWSTTRIQFAVDASDKPYIRYTEDADTASPTYVDLGADFTVGTDSTRVTFGWNDDDGLVTIADDKGNETVHELDGTPDFGFLDKYGTMGTDPGEFDELHGICYGNGSFYVSDLRNQRIQRFDEGWNYIGGWNVYDDGDPLGTQLYPVDVSYDTAYGDIYLTASINNDFRVATYLQRYSRDGVFISQHSIPYPYYYHSVAIDNSGAVWATLHYVMPGWIYHRLRRFSTFPGSYTDYGSTGSGQGQFIGPMGVVTDSARNVYVADSANHRIQVFDEDFTFIREWGSYGTGNGQFNYPWWLGWDPNGNLVVGDKDNYRYQVFNTDGTYLSQWGSSGTGDGQYTTIGGIVSHPSDQNIYTTDKYRVQWFGITWIYPHFDNSYISAGETEDVIVGENNNSSIDTVTFIDTDTDATFELINDTGDSETYWEEKINGNDLLVVDGTWEEWLVNDSVTITLSPLESIDPQLDIPLKDSSQYSDPGTNQQNVILPLPYGNIRENSDQGVWVCPLIDALNHVYCVAGWPIQSVANGNIVEVYVSGVLQISGYTFNESNNYESNGYIATVTFTSAPSGDVTVSCNGKWVDSTLLTNPINIIEDFLDYVATLTETSPWAVNETSLAIARNIAEVAGYSCAGVIASNNSLSYWLKSILNSFLGDFRINSRGEIEVKILPLSSDENIKEWVDEHESISLTLRQSIDNICGHVIINYAKSIASIDRRYKEGGDPSYFRTYEELRLSVGTKIWTLNFDWCRRTSNIELMADILLNIYADPEYIVTYQGQDFKYAPLDIGDHVSATLSQLLDSNGTIREDVLYAIREKNLNLDDFTTQLILCSENFAQTSNSPNYLYIGDGSVYIGNDRIFIGE